MQARHCRAAANQLVGCSAPLPRGRHARLRRELRRDAANAAAPRIAVVARGGAHSPPRTAAAPVAALAPAQQASPPQHHHHNHHHHEQGRSQQQPPAAAQWLEQAVPALVRHLSRDARSHDEHYGTWLQVVHQLPARHQQQQHSGGAQQARISLEHRRLLDFSPATASAVWSEMQATLTQPSSGRDAIAVVLARPIPDPSHLCPLTSSTSSTSSCEPAAAAAARAPPSMAADEAAAAGGVVEMQGLVDLDGCCGGSDGTMAATSPSSSLTALSSAVCSPAPTRAHAPPAPSSPALSALARQLVDAPTDSATTSSSSSSDDELPTATTSVAQPPVRHAAPQPHASHHHHHDHSHPHHQHKSKSRRRFLRRQQQQQQQRAAAAAAEAGAVAGGSAGPETVYYGLAVQSLPVGAHQQQQQQQQQQPSGCYVLKLSSNRDATGCTCTVFTVTHVCKGQPLYAQLVNSWLAEPVAAGGSAAAAW